MRQADIDDGYAPGVTTAEAQRIRGARAGEPGAAAGQRDPEAGGEFLRGGARPPTQEVVAFIDANRDEFGVEPICTVVRIALQVAPSTYYAAKTRPPSARALPRRGDRSGAGRRCGRTTTGSTAPASSGRPPGGPATTSAVTRSPG